MDIRSRALTALSLKLMPPPMERTVDYGAYDAWRTEHLAASWAAFDDAHIRGKDVLDFGCGDGQMSFYLARQKAPASIVGVDLNPDAIARANCRRPDGVRFLVGDESGIPCSDRSFDTVLAFDCMEHVMDPASILAEWYRVLRPGGRVLIEWFPYKGPWGPHMESLIPVPWAHYVFGERAMFRAAAEIYDHPRFQPRHWDLDDDGQKRPNKWRQWETFADQGYINQLNIPAFRSLAAQTGFAIPRLEKRGFSGPPWRQAIGRLLMGAFGEMFCISTVVELKR